MPPIYQPQVAAEAVVYAADHPRRREYGVGFSTIATITGNRIAGGLLDRYLARTGYRSQQTQRPSDPTRPANLWEPVDDADGADFGARPVLPASPGPQPRIVDVTSPPRADRGRRRRSSRCSGWCCLGVARTSVSRPRPAERRRQLRRSARRDGDVASCSGPTDGDLDIASSEEMKGHVPHIVRCAALQGRVDRARRRHSGWDRVRLHGRAHHRRSDRCPRRPGRPGRRRRDRHTPRTSRRRGSAGRNGGSLAYCASGTSPAMEVAWVRHCRASTSSLYFHGCTTRRGSRTCCSKLSVWSCRQCWRWRSCTHLSYTRGVPRERYDFTDRSIESLEWAGVAPVDVLAACESRPRVRRFIGSSLQLIGRDRAGKWLAVALVETQDDVHEVTGARYLEPDEVASVERLMGGPDDE